MEYEGDSDTICCQHTWNNSQSIGTGTGRRGNKRTRGDHPDYGVIVITIIIVNYSII